ncbi:NADPH-dependent FMN reductase [Streptomyces sp. MST-110588]|uniref:NADPH-dependent FMN reductase n=1 Tax=Streptomyces sp. MST-110588 TaxID=2833628 RepID=UPI001F5CEDD1|nr:NADPH-dependent FMN reductase [Streptomyces sp. MST-110588]UNO41983.1 NAD(P)H-dependent oxidoreductase [Streptomyces sp. MST-110588]
MTELNVLAISGSLREKSYNTSLLYAAQELVPQGMSIRIHSDLRELPLYDQDLDTPTPPDSVLAWRREIEQADALLIATPEHNASVPAALKNAIDWASTGADAALIDKPAAIIGASPGAFGSGRAQLALRQILASIGSDLVVKPEVAVFRCHERFDTDGVLTDRFSRQLLTDLLTVLATKVHNRRMVATMAT